MYFSMLQMELSSFLITFPDFPGWMGKETPGQATQGKRSLSHICLYRTAPHFLADAFFSSTSFTKHAQSSLRGHLPSLGGGVQAVFPSRQAWAMSAAQQNPNSVERETFLLPSKPIYSLLHDFKFCQGGWLVDQD